MSAILSRGDGLSPESFKPIAEIKDIDMKNMMTEYACGFVFTEDRSEVLLIQKQRPAWQRGYFNGIGGHIEQDESARDAMIRETKEETCLEISADRWTNFAVLELEGEAVVYFFFTFESKMKIQSHRSPTDEKVQLIRISQLPGVHELIPNLRWLIPLALNWRNHIAPVRYAGPIMIRERGGKEL